MLERKNGRVESVETLDSTPYVVSEDIRLLLQNWANQRDFNLPNFEFFSDIRGELKSYMKQIFNAFELVSEVELLEGIKERVEKSRLFPVSLDRVYYNSEISLNITRFVEKSGQNRGLGGRVGAPNLLQQFRALKKSGVNEVVLVDDVIFTGDLIKRTGKLLEKMGIKVPLVCAGIGITNGIEELNGYGKEVSCVREYEDVIDEICERDFYPGVPMCGRSLQGNENVGVPYILPFGNPGRWASIPTEWQEPFSRFCIDQTIKLFEAIEENSGKVVQCKDLERKVSLLPTDETRFVDVLRQI